jgi:hypothetical protein
LMWDEVEGQGDSLGREGALGARNAKSMAFRLGRSNPFSPTVTLELGDLRDICRIVVF